MHSRHLLDALYDFFVTARALAAPRYTRRQGFLIGRPNAMHAFNGLSSQLQTNVGSMA
jgi:hypothetical protein